MTAYLRKSLTLVSALTLTIGTLALITPKTLAAGVTPSITPNTQTVSTAGSISISFATSAALAVGSDVTLSYPSTYAGTLSTANTTVNGTAPTTVTNSTAGSEVSSRLVLAAGVASGGTVTINTTALTSPAAAGNYAFKISSSIGDSGANFQYVGEANVVQVRALVPVSLSFAIRTSDDSANTNTCDLGTASTTAVSTCEYRLKVGTNATNGYVIAMRANGNLSNGSRNMNNAAAGAAGSAVTAGTEMYGATITKGAITGGTTTLSTAYDADSNAVNYTNTTAATMLTASGSNNPTATGDVTNTTLVTHKLGISNNTGSGLYTQTITYTVTPSF